MAATTAGVKRPRERIKIAFTQDYVETSLLGAGGFGEAVAIKRVRYSSDDDDDEEGRTTKNRKQAQAEVMQEAQFLDACRGLPFLVGYHGLARDLATSDLCLLMELVAGPSLHAYLLAQRQPLSEPTVRSLMWQLLTGARHMHQRHVVHRDIKPGNILLDGDKRSVGICDLGLAVSTKLTPPYAQAGTLTYMAPEMLLGMTDYDERVDAWSLGCVMVELVLRRTLFEGDDDDENEEVDQLAAIFDVLGVPDGRTWRGFKSLPLSGEVTKKLQKRQKRNRLRDMFPEETLSKEGFDVLSGLLTSNPAKRLTASAALKLPWFNNVAALSLPQKNQEVEPAVHKRKRVVIIPPATSKRKRVVIIPPAMPQVLCAAAWASWDPSLLHPCMYCNVLTTCSEQAEHA